MHHILCGMGKKHSKPKKQKNCTDNNQDLNESLCQRIHENPIFCVDIYGNNLLSGNSIGELHNFSLTNKQLQAKLAIHERDITKIVANKDASTVFTASRDKLIKQTDLITKSIINTFDGHDLIVTGLSGNANKTKLSSGSRDCCMKLWDVETAKNLSTCHINRNIVTDMKWADSQDIIVQCSEDKIMKLWDVKNLKNTSTFPLKQYFQTCCDFDGEKFQVLTGSTGGNGNGCEVILWDIRKIKPIQVMKGHTDRITDCKFFKNNHDRLSAISVSNDCSVKIWDLVSYKCICTTFITGAKGVTSVAVENNFVCVGTHEDGIHVYDFDADQQKLQHAYCM